MSLLPMEVRARLIAASTMPKHLRSKAIDDVYTWARLHYPKCFTDSPEVSFVPPEAPLSTTKDLT